MRTPHEFTVEVFLNQPANSNGQVFLRLFFWWTVSLCTNHVDLPVANSLSAMKRNFEENKSLAQVDIAQAAM